MHLLVLGCTLLMIMMNLLTNSGRGRNKSNLYVSSRPASSIHKQTSKYWENMGELHRKEQGKSVRIDDRLYCKLCYQEEIKKERGLLTNIYSLSPTSSTSNFFNHAESNHTLLFTKPQSAKMTAWVTRTTSCRPAASGYELNRDLAVWTCTDLLPFDLVEKPGLKKFNEKNLHLQLPTASTLAATALVDVYGSTKRAVKEKLSDMVSGTLMMDGWTDRYHRKPYFGIRISTICAWKFEVFTLAVMPVRSHTADSLHNFVRDVVEAFLPKERKPLLFNTTDGAANMLKLSRLLGHERTTCVAHSLHNLIVTDAICKVPRVQVNVEKAKEIVRTLHFRTEEIMDESLYLKEVDFLNSISSLQEDLHEDENNPITDSDSEPPANTNNICKTHVTLKNSVPTRWNSILVMIDSLLTLHKQANEVLKKIGKAELQLRQEDIEELQQLHAILSPFQEFTLIVSQVAPNLAAVPLIRGRIRKLCTPTPADSQSIKSLKNLIIQNMDRRLPVSKLVQIASCFDPSVRDVILTKEECRELLSDVYDELRMSRHSSTVFHTEEEHMVDIDHVENDEGTKQAGASNKRRLHLCDVTDDIQNQTLKRFRRELISDAIGLEGNAPTDERQTLNQEISRYLEMSEDDSPLAFWQKREKTLPKLSAMAKVYMSLSPGSVPVESLFSITGLILNRKRSSMAPHRCNMVSFVHDNIKFLEQY